MTHADPARVQPPRIVYLDLTHLGRHVTGIERVTIEQFEKVTFEGADVRPVRASGVAAMIFKQHVVLPLLALRRRKAHFLFPGFPPSPIFRLARERVHLYVHDAFLITRPQDLSRKARLYMAWPFRVAVTGLKHFLTNSEKTRAELQPFVRADATIALYRPAVTNIFQLDAGTRARPRAAGQPLRMVALGTVEPRKNYAAAAAILDRLRATGDPGAELHIIGRAGWGEAGQALAGYPGVTVHGYLEAEKVRALLQSADVYLCTSHDEGLGLPLLEAQFAGLAIAAPDASVFREVLGASGWFIDPSRPDEAAASIRAKLSEPAARQRAAEAAAANLARWNGAAGEDLSRVRTLFSRSDPASLTQGRPEVA